MFNIEKDANILLSVGDKYGYRSCDGKCFDAQEPECDCVCGGKNHGIGFKQALKFTIERKPLYDKMYGKKLTYGQEVMKSIMGFAE